MKRNLILPLALAAAALGFAAGRWTSPSADAFDPGRDLGSAALTPLLGLTAAQATEISAIESEYDQATSSANDAQCLAKCQLAAALGSHAFDAEAVRALIASIHEARKANELATLDQIQRIKSVLTPEQRNQFLTLMGECLCADCGATGQVCCPTTNLVTKKES